MNVTADTVLLVAALICFVIAALPLASPINWQALGLAFLAGALLVGGG